VTREVIDRFSGEYECFSNFFVEKDGKTVEHRFQSKKPTDPAIAAKIMAAPTARKARDMGRSRTLFKIRPDWEQVKDSIMEGLVREKFLNDRVILAELLSTGDAELIEGNWWHDQYWGMVRGTDGKWKGKNQLGKILMKLREQFRVQARLA